MEKYGTYFWRFAIKTSEIRIFSNRIQIIEPILTILALVLSILVI